MYIYPTVDHSVKSAFKMYPEVDHKVKSDYAMYPEVDDTVKPYSKRGVGHPTKYQEDLTIAQTFDYLDECKDKFVEVEVLTESGEIARRKLYKYEKEEGMQDDEAEAKTRTINRFEIPSVAGLAKYLGVSRETVYAWEKEHDEYSDTLRVLRAEQEIALINGGVSGQYNSNIVTLIMKKEHGYTDKIDLTTQGESIVYDDKRINDIIKARQERTDRE